MATLHNVEAELRNADGTLAARRRAHNVICTGGKSLLLASGTAKSVAAFDQLAVGTGGHYGPDAGPLPATTDTALVAEVARLTAAIARADDDPTNDWIIQFAVVFPAGTGTGTITESCLDYQGAPSGAILARVAFPGLVKGATQTLGIKWQIKSD